MIRAVTEVDWLTNQERPALLGRAPATIKAYGDEIDYSETPANDTGPGDVVFELNEKARLIETLSYAEVTAAVLEAIETIKAGRLLLEAKHGMSAGFVLRFGEATGGRARKQRTNLPISLGKLSSSGSWGTKARAWPVKLDAYTRGAGLRILLSPQSLDDCAAPT